MFLVTFKDSIHMRYIGNVHKIAKKNVNMIC
jgi:hypothetical protein